MLAEGATSRAATTPRGSARYPEILATAADLFWAKGYNATTMSELAAALGLRKASLYHHIDKKETLLYELSVDSLARVTEAADAALARETEPEARLRALIMAHVLTSLSDRSKHATMLSELRALTSGERDRISELRDGYDQLVERTISEGQQARCIRSDIPPQLLRLALLNMLNWTIFWFRTDGELSPGELAELFATIFLEGAGTRRTPHK